MNPKLTSTTTKKHLLTKQREGVGEGWGAYRGRDGGGEVLGDGGRGGEGGLGIGRRRSWAGSGGSGEVEGGGGEVEGGDSVVESSGGRRR